MATKTIILNSRIGKFTTIDDLSEEEFGYSPLAYRDDPFLDSDIWPFYVKQSSILGGLYVMVGRNMITGQLGKFICDPHTHSMLQVEVADVEYDFEEIMKHAVNPRRRIVHLLQSISTRKVVGLIRGATCKLEKLNLAVVPLVAMTPVRVETKAADVQELLDKALLMKNHPLFDDRAIVKFYDTVVHHMIIKKSEKFQGVVVDFQWNDIIPSVVQEMSELEITEEADYDMLFDADEA